jgi:hypothetical protein
MKAVARFSLAALALGLVAAPASAQLLGLPVVFAPAPAGITIGGMFGRGLNTASGKANSAGGMFTYGGGMFQVGAGASYFDFDVAKTISFGGNVGVNLPLGPSLPVKIMIVGGASYASKNGVKNMFIPGGVTFGFNVPSTGVSVTPWVSPQVRYSRIDPGTGTTFSSTDFGGSGGISIGLPVGVGFDLALDYTNVSGGSPFLVGAGIHYTIKTPGSGAGM